MWREVITLTGLHCSMQDAEGIVLKESFVLVKHAHTPWHIPRCQRLNGSLGFCAYHCRRRHTHTHTHTHTQRYVKATCGSTTVEPPRNVEGEDPGITYSVGQDSVCCRHCRPNPRPPTTQHPATQSSPLPILTAAAAASAKQFPTSPALSPSSHSAKPRSAPENSNQTGLGWYRALWV